MKDQTQVLKHNRGRKSRRIGVAVGHAEDKNDESGEDIYSVARARYIWVRTSSANRLAASNETMDLQKYF